MIHINVKNALNDVFRNLQGTNVNLDYVRYNVDWLCAILTRFGNHVENVEDSLLVHLQEARDILATLDDDLYIGDKSLSRTQTGSKGRPKFNIPREQLELLIDYGFKGSEIAKLLYVCKKTIYRRLEEYGLSMRESYSTITGDELDVLVKEILREFPNNGYKSMRGHLLARGIKLQENRVREVMRRADPEGVLVRALQLRTTHRRIYNVRGPLSLWHMDGHHKLIR